MTRGATTTRDLQPEDLRRRPLGGYRYVRLRWRVIAALLDGLGGAIFALGRGVGRTLRPLTTWLGGRPAVPAEALPPRRILLVQLDHLGDALLTTALLPALRRQWPQASIEVLASEAAREVFELAAEVDRVHVARLHRLARSRWARCFWLAGMVGWGLRLRARRFDVAIDVRGDLSLALILWLTGAPRRVGWTCGGGGFLLTQAPAYVADRPEVESRRALVTCLGIEPRPEEPFQPQCQPSAVARRRVARDLHQSLPEQKLSAEVAPLVVLHVGAGTAAKRWPVAHWQRLTRWLVETGDAHVVLVGGAAERACAESIGRCSPGPAVLNWAGRLTLDELAALLEQARLVIGADSGPAHLAAAVGAPQVVLFSGTNTLRQWCPPGAQVAALRHPVACSPCHRECCPLAGHPCMTLLQPEQVIAAVGALLERRGPLRDDSMTKVMP